MKKKSILKSQEGFTLVEIIAVLIILGILAAVAVPRYLDLETSSKSRALDAAVAELNGRESLAWADTKIRLTRGWVGNTDTDATLDGTVPRGVFPKVAPSGVINLGNDYIWTTGPSATGGVINFKGSTMTVDRATSTNSQPAVWTRRP